MTAVKLANPLGGESNGSVTGDIASPHLAIVDGGCLQGKVDMPQGRSSQPARPTA